MSSESVCISSTLQPLNGQLAVVQQGYLDSKIQAGYPEEKRSLEDEPAISLLSEPQDLEAQPQQNVSSISPEVLTPLRTKFVFIALYVSLKLCITLSNKSLLDRLSVPWLLTTLHATATSIGTFVMMGTRRLTLAPLSLRLHLILLAFSLLFTLNIAIANVSLAMVSVPLHQVLRSTCPIVTVLIYRSVFARSYSRATYLSIALLVIGAGLASAGDFQASLLGMTLTIIGAILASIEAIVASHLMIDHLSLSPVELLLRLSPLAAMQCMAYAFMTGELDTTRRFRQLEGGFSWSFTIGIMVNACMAIALDINSIQTNKSVGALTASVCGNVRQALTILMGVVLFNVPVGIVNALGMCVTMVGTACFSMVELAGKKAQSLTAT